MAGILKICFPVSNDFSNYYWEVNDLLIEIESKIKSKPIKDLEKIKYFGKFVEGLAANVYTLLRTQLVHPENYKFSEFIDEFLWSYTEALFYYRNQTNEEDLLRYLRDKIFFLTLKHVLVIERLKEEEKRKILDEMVRGLQPNFQNHLKSFKNLTLHKMMQILTDFVSDDDSPSLWKYIYYLDEKILEKKKLTVSEKGAKTEPVEVALLIDFEGDSEFTSNVMDIDETGTPVYFDVRCDLISSNKKVNAEDSKDVTLIDFENVIDFSGNTSVNNSLSSNLEDMGGTRSDFTTGVTEGASRNEECVNEIISAGIDFSVKNENEVGNEERAEAAAMKDAVLINFGNFNDFSSNTKEASTIENNADFRNVSPTVSNKFFSSVPGDVGGAHGDSGADVTERAGSGVKWVPMHERSGSADTNVFPEDENNELQKEIIEVEWGVIGGDADIDEPLYIIWDDDGKSCEVVNSKDNMVSSDSYDSNKTDFSTHSLVMGCMSNESWSNFSVKQDKSDADCKDEENVTDPEISDFSRPEVMEVQPTETMDFQADTLSGHELISKNIHNDGKRKRDASNDELELVHETGKHCERGDFQNSDVAGREVHELEEVSEKPWGYNTPLYLDGAESTVTEFNKQGRVQAIDNFDGSKSDHNFFRGLLYFKNWGLEWKFDPG